MHVHVHVLRPSVRCCYSEAVLASKPPGPLTRAPCAGAARLQAAPRRRLGRQSLGGRGAVAAAARGGRAGGHLAGRRGGDHTHRPRAGHIPAAARRRRGAAGRRRAARVLACRAAPPSTAARPRRNLALRVRLVGGRRRRAALCRVVRGGGAQRWPRRLPLVGSACCKRRLVVPQLVATPAAWLAREASGGWGRSVQCGGAPPPLRRRWWWQLVLPPQRGDSSILGASRAAEARTGYKDCKMPEWMAALPMVRLRLREDVIAAGERSGYQAPHYIYVLHVPCIRHA
eukprot:scaffold70355_cov72-Phaeocystis_antarctica.AAC.3